jgi:tRNA(Ile)-lysidine synthase TilS/MesJ
VAELAKENNRIANLEKTLTKRYRKTIWVPFITALKRYQMISEGDKICVCISGGKDSMLLAKLMQILQRNSEIPFTLSYLVMDPGYSPENRRKIEENAALLGIPVTIFEKRLFDVVERSGGAPCYLCARMRRGALYEKARELGCNKIALGHHFNDVVETTLLGMFYSSQLQAMLPKLHSTNFEGMELIRPLYCVHEEAVIDFAASQGLSFIRCGCPLSGRDGEDADCDTAGGSKRAAVKALLAQLKQEDPDIEKSIFNSIHDVCLDTFPGYKEKGVLHSFLDQYDEC